MQAFARIALRALGRVPCPAGLPAATEALRRRTATVGSVSLIVYLLALVVSGFIVGGLARLALPGPDPMSFLQTTGVGVGGSLLAGIVTYLIFGQDYAGFILSLLFAMGIVYLIRRSRGGSLTEPGRRPIHRR